MSRAIVEFTKARLLLDIKKLEEYFENYIDKVKDIKNDLHFYHIMALVCEDDHMKKKYNTFVKLLFSKTALKILDKNRQTLYTCFFLKSFKDKISISIE
jgi:hypothetical protein